MGRYYAEAAGTKPEIAHAIELHYKPKGPSDTVPNVEDGDAVAVAVALADKLDTLVGFWAIDEKPTGSGDPYQLRRAALGVIRIVLENDLRLRLTDRPPIHAMNFVIDLELKKGASALRDMNREITEQEIKQILAGPRGRRPNVVGVPAPKTGA